VEFLKRPVCPPDAYFALKVSMQKSPSSTDAELMQNTLKYQERAAIEFVQEGILKDSDTYRNRMS
jgi:hypothetical protein